MNIDKLVDHLSRLGNLRPQKATIAIDEPGLVSVPIVVCGLGVHAVKFSDCIFLNKLPEDWKAALPHGPDFAELSADQLEAACQSLEQRICSRAWHLELPETSAKIRHELLNQNADRIVKFDIFATISFRVILDLKACAFRSQSLQEVQLDHLLTRFELQEIFSACR